MVIKIFKPVFIYLISRIFTLGIFVFVALLLKQWNNLPSFGYSMQEVLTSWDSQFYVDIVKNGYHKEFLTVWFPLYPMTVKLLNMLGVEIYLAAFLISNTTLLIASIYFYLLVSKLYNRNIATFALILFLFSPITFFYSTIYTESLFTMLTVLAFYFLYEKRWLYFSIFAALAAITRNAGVFILVPFAYLYFKEYRFNKQSVIRLCGYTSIVISGVVFYMAYLYWRWDNPILFVTLQSGWDHYLTVPFWDFLMHLKNFTVDFQLKVTADRVNISFMYTAVAILLIIYSRMRIKSELWIYTLVIFVF